MGTELLNVFKGFTKREKIETFLFFLLLIIAQAIARDTIFTFLWSILGVFNIILARKRSRLCYIFAFMQVALYIYIFPSTHSSPYGNIIFNLFYLTMQLIGFYLWSKKSESGVVKVRTLSFEKYAVLVIIWCITVFFHTTYLQIHGNDFATLNAIIIASYIIAILLGIQAYEDQWDYWILCNICVVFIHLTIAINGDYSSYIKAIVWIVYLINSIFAKKEWKKLSQKPIRVT